MGTNDAVQLARGKKCIRVHFYTLAGNAVFTVQ